MGPLSWEHVPPEKAGNEGRVVNVAGPAAVHVRPWDPPRGKIEQRGVGEYTLCPKCNNDTGSWYGDSLVAFSAQAVGVLLRSARPTRALAVPYLAYPLRVLKQIVTMMFSVTPPSLRVDHPDIVRFVLDKGRRGLPKPFRVFVYYTTGSATRWVGAAQGRIGTRVCIMSELTFAPFGYVMTWGTEAPHPDQCEITSFGAFGYDDFKGVHLALPTLHIESPFPADYRTREQVARQPPRLQPVVDEHGNPTSIMELRLP